MFPQLKRKNKIPLQTTLSTSCLVFCPPHHSLTFKKNCGCHSLTTCFHLFHLFHTDVLMKQLSLKGPMLSPHQACVMHRTPTTCNMGVERIHFLKTAANKGVTPHTHIASWNSKEMENWLPPSTSSPTPTLPDPIPKLGGGQRKCRETANEPRRRWSGCLAPRPLAPCFVNTGPCDDWDHLEHRACASWCTHSAMGPFCSVNVYKHPLRRPFCCRTHH